MASRNEVIKAVVIFMELHGRILTEKEYAALPDTPVNFRFLHRNFGSWKRVLGRCTALFPARMAALRAGSGVPIAEEPDNSLQVVANDTAGPITALQALALLKAASRREESNETE